MNNKYKFAFCTNFSSNSLKRLESILFHFWNFNLGVDLIHLKEDDEDDSQQKMAAGYSVSNSASDFGVLVPMISV